MSELSSGKRKRGGKREKNTPKSFKRATSEEPQETLTHEEYERLKTALLRRAVLAENQHLALRTRLKENKIREAEEYKTLVADGKCPEFVAAKKEMEELRDKKKDINLAVREMKLAQILDEFDAETQMNHTQYDDNYVYSKGRFISFFKELIAEKQRREQEIGGIMAALLKIHPLPTEATERPVLTEVIYEGRQTRSRSKMAEREEEDRTRTEKRKPI